MMRIIKSINNIERYIFGLLIVGLTISVFLYVYFLSTSVMSVVQRKNIEVQITFLSSSISDLESEYMFLTKSITPAYARSIGFVEPKKVTFTRTDAFAINSVE